MAETSHLKISQRTELIAATVLSTKYYKPVFSGFVETDMVEELITLALYLKELQMRDKFGGILD